MSRISKRIAAGKAAENQISIFGADEKKGSTGNIPKTAGINLESSKSQKTDSSDSHLDPEDWPDISFPDQAFLTAIAVDVEYATEWANGNHSGCSNGTAPIIKPQSLHTARLYRELGDDLPQPAPCPSCGIGAFWTSVYRPLAPICSGCQPEPSASLVRHRLQLVHWRGRWRWMDGRDEPGAVIARVEAERAEAERAEAEDRERAKIERMNSEFEKAGF